MMGGQRWVAGYLTHARSTVIYEFPASDSKLILPCLLLPQDKAASDNRANQMNPTSPAYEQVRTGQATAPAGDDNNRANQLNPNHAEYKGGAVGAKSGSK